MRTTNLPDLELLRELLHRVDPAELTTEDTLALIGLAQRAMESHDATRSGAPASDV